MNRYCFAGGLEIVTLSHSSFICASVEKHVMERREEGQGEVHACPNLSNLNVNFQEPHVM